MILGRNVMDRLETVDQVVEKYCVSSSPLRSKLYLSTGSLLIFFAIILVDELIFNDNCLEGMTKICHLLNLERRVVLRN